MVNNYKLCASVQHVQRTVDYISPMKSVSVFWSSMATMWQTTSDHCDSSTVALPEPDSPLPDLPDLKNAAMSAASFAASSSPSPALMAVVASVVITIGKSSKAFIIAMIIYQQKRILTPFIEADPVIQAVLPSLSERPPPPFWPRRENPSDRSAALRSWDVREKRREEGGGDSGRRRR